jgi:hypothetical protein
MLSISLALLLAVVAPALALPNAKRSGCDLSNATLSLPSNQTALTNPTSSPSFVGLGVGVQNYTCNDTSLTYSSAGAVVEVFDISCFSGSSLFNTIQNDAFNIWNNVSSNVTTQDVIKAFGDAPVVLGQHYFIANGSSISPVWDFTSDAEKGNAEAFVVAAVVGDIPAPTGADDVDWLQLKKVEGELADTVYRVETKGGQPPASCTAGAPLLSVKFTTQYWLFGGCVKQ